MTLSIAAGLEELVERHAPPIQKQLAPKACRPGALLI
jgi:hypothetical protein